MAINNTALTTSISPIFTSSGNTAITTIHLCNYTANSIQANIFAVTSGDAANVSNIIYSNVTITGYNTLIIYQEKFILSNGDFIAANASAGSSITATVSSIGI